MEYARVEFVTVRVPHYYHIPGYAHRFMHKPRKNVRGKDKIVDLYPNEILSQLQF
jgi:hypothetical protein